MHDSDVEDEDSSKRQKLNELPPNTSAGSPSQAEGQEAPNFPKFKSKFKKRNYRSQSNSDDVMSTSSNPTRSEEGTHEESSSSQSIEFREDAEGIRDSSDERSEAAGGKIDNIIVGMCVCV